ncbi:MAG: hypothetical protein K2L14_09025 [Duncaniella sp.]|nr:hypothetical protein [Duncaniella sp.]
MEYLLQDIADAIIPVSIVVVLPVMIVWLVTRCKTNRDNKNAEILMKAVENNTVQDVDKFLVGMPKPSKTMKEIMLNRLLIGCIFAFVGIPLMILGVVNAGLGDDFSSFCWIAGAVCAAIGLAYLVVYRVTRKMVEKEDNSSEN